MTANFTTKYAIEVLCANHGSLEYSELLRQVKQYFGVTDDQGLELPEDSRLLVTYGKVDSTNSSSPSVDDKKVVAVTSVRVCSQFYSTDGCSDTVCPNLHMCRHFIRGNCRFNARRCRYSHDFHSMHNARILCDGDLLDLDDSHLRVLLLQNDVSLLRGACHLYNKSNGNDEACTFEKCQRLHICQQFLNGNCRFGDKCKRSHDFEKNACIKLENQGFEHSSIPNLLSLYHNSYLINNPNHAKPKDPAFSKRRTFVNTKRNTGNEEIGLNCNAEPTTCARQVPVNPKRNADSEEICVNFVAKNCRYKVKCFKHHYSLPYRWQFFNSSKWEDFSNVEQIENAYCEPSNSKSAGIQCIDFQMMICDSNQVRRLSTPSSVTKPPHVILTTVWIWYWKDEYNIWVEYGNQGENHRASTATSSVLEKAYQENNDGVISFQAGRYEYELRFKDMIQENKSLKTQREVRRRPKFVSAKDLEDVRKRRPTQTNNVPSNWDKSALPDVGYKLVPLPESSEEYNEIKTLFKKTMDSSTIQKIERIQNLSLWEVFQWQKEQMKKNNNGRDVDERLLFHGTDDSIVDAICHQNFDWRICGAHGTAYGKGSYFARDASYSNGYSNSTSDSKNMFVARVLVGQCVEGISSYLRPPSKNGKANDFYDSCVNNVSNPSIFVIFEKHQIYPQYLIKYCDKATAPVVQIKSPSIVTQSTAPAYRSNFQTVVTQNTAYSYHSNRPSIVSQSAARANHISSPSIVPQSTAPANHINRSWVVSQSTTPANHISSPSIVPQSTAPANHINRSWVVSQSTTPANHVNSPRVVPHSTAPANHVNIPRVVPQSTTPTYHSNSPRSDSQSTALTHNINTPRVVPQSTKLAYHSSSSRGTARSNSSCLIC
ncbi:protein mono-ADP-ribosyltransferase PARP12-like isoform X3 [Protopterus annectens]|uniref:protein mono-ADP-ribosyltransferase PARP12-like isoform X3 n=1 Tax=Protopterus annectens TaxID=7888 RepID=UPI001CF9C6AD|nr:protein mono-ADP-ribosyltransferase PARP12-like isoform X3 [Protopterus annectens]